MQSDVVNSGDAMTNYVYHLYGDNAVFFAEFSYSLGTLLKHIDRQKSRIIVFTDCPDKFRHLPVVCESIAGKIAEMKGPHGFGFRIKLCCILKCAESFSGNIIYLDCDTIAREAMPQIAAQLKNGCVYMYRQEKLAGRFPQFNGFQMRLPDNTTYRYSEDSCMFNAGVIGVSRRDAGLLKTALTICDRLLEEGRKSGVCEQLAVSETFRISGLKILAADRAVFHYYRSSAKKYMHHRLSQFAAEQKTEPWKFEPPIPYSYPRVQLFKLMRRLVG